jgi:tetratricopeptide (TPR) repeat protein
MGFTGFLIGVVVQSGEAQNKRPVYNAEMLKGKNAKESATVLLDGAMYFAENGSWERIAVGRAWYLGGDKAKGQGIFDAVTNNKKVEASDWFRIGRVYAEAQEWEKAVTAFDRALSADQGDDSGMIEYGSLANIQGDRVKAEALFERAMKKNSNEFWHWVNAGGSYLGVKPQ